MFTVIQWLLNIPCYDISIRLLVMVLASVVRILTFAIGRNLLVRLAKLYTGFPDDAAMTTADFLESPKGVEQSM